MLAIKSSKNILFLYHQQGELSGEFTKIYEVKLEEQDLYHTDAKQLIVFRKVGVMEVYHHVPFVVSEDVMQVEKDSYRKLRQGHLHLVRRVRCSSFGKEEVATCLLLSEALGFVMVGTNQGNVKQYLWPLQGVANPNPAEVFTQQVSSHRILSISMDANLTSLYAVS